MDNKTYVRQTGPARGKLVRLQRDLGKATRSFRSTTRTRTVGGVLLLVGLLALILFLVNGSTSVAVIAVACLAIGGVVLIRALVTRGRARHSMSTMTADVADAQATLTELEAQPHTSD